MNQLLIKCPTCRKTGPWLAGKSGPFCSPRCKLIDLGGWLDERHVIPTPLRPEHLEPYSEMPAGPHLDRPEPDAEI